MANMDVHMGETAIGKGDDTLLVSGVGSCVVITLYDMKRKIGALAHAMLPSRRSSLIAREAYLVKRISSDPSPDASPFTLHASRDTRYIDEAIDVMLEKMQIHGAKREDMEAKLIGGADMFSAFKSSIGKGNIAGAREKLKRENIPVVSECVGGSQGRSVEFSVASGIVTVKMKF